MRGLLVASLALGGAVVIAATGQAAVNPDIQVLSITQYGPDSGGQFQLVGEVRNAGTATAGPVSVDVTFLDAADNVLFEDNTFTNVDAIGPGERAPFALTFPPMANYTHYRYVVNDGGGAVVNHNFDVTVTSRTFDGTYDHVLGTLKNNNTTTSQFTQVVGTAYDVNNLAVDVDSDFVSGVSSDVAPGATANFELIFLGGRRYDPGRVAAGLAEPRHQPGPEPDAEPDRSRRPDAGTRWCDRYRWPRRCHAGQPQADADRDNLTDGQPDRFAGRQSDAARRHRLPRRRRSLRPADLAGRRQDDPRRHRQPGGQAAPERQDLPGGHDRRALRPRTRNDAVPHLADHDDRQPGSRPRGLLPPDC
jgi:hypothetical protein